VLVVARLVADVCSVLLWWFEKGMLESGFDVSRKEQRRREKKKDRCNGSCS